MSGLAARRVPGEAGIWIFIMGDMLMFGLFFCLYTHGFAENRAMFLAGQATLNKPLGLANTLLLLTVSWFVVLGLEAARAGFLHRASHFLAAGIATGLAFIVVKGFEYAGLIGQGFTLITNPFYAYYFIVTGIHLGHVMAGVTVLGFFWHDARRQAGAKNAAALETAGCYWHMVDVLWIGIFALIYLVR